MKIDIRFAHLHTPLFFGGKSFGDKLEHGKHEGLAMTYDTEEPWIRVFWKNREGLVPMSNVASLSPMEEKPFAVDIEKPKAVTGPIKAQVSSPTDHVFAGMGAGLVKDKAKS